MTILKDASATAIYGSRASNGVIIITTKKGTAGKPQVNFAANWHVNTARKTLDMMDASTYRKYMEEYSEAGAARMGDANTDWQKEVLRTSFSQDYSLSVGGTAGFLPYRVNASYTNNQGIVKTSNMQRATVGFNLNPKFFNGKLSINANAQGSWCKTNDADVSGALGGAIAMDPTLPIYKQWNTIGDTGMTMFNGYNNFITPSGSPNSNASENPVQLLNDKKSQGEVLASNGNIQIDYALHFLPELHFNLNLGYQVSQNNWKTDTSANSVMSWRNGGLSTMGSAGAATQWKKWELQRNTLLDFYVNYRKEFAAIKSNLDVMAGYSWQKFTYMGNENTFVTGKGLSYTYDAIADQYDLQWNHASESNIGKAVNNSVGLQWAAPLQLVSFFGRLNYTYDDTYLLTFTLRDDGTSRFSKDNRWGLFPSLALGWKIANMPFFESVRDKWNDLKLRLGWGVTGQQDVSGYFPYMPIYSVSYQNGYQYLNPNGNGEWIEPIYPEPYDPDIKWEETTTWNIGIDAAWLNNRITLAADWYLRDTKDLLSQTTVYGVNTKDVMLSNIGSMRNMGVEVTIGAKPVVTKNFTWSTSYNVAFNKNKITALTNDANVAKLPITDRRLPVGNSGDLQWHEVGQPAFTFKVYQQVYDEAGDPIEGVYVDQNGDGIIDTQDLINFHTPTPDWTMTWNNNFNYKNWDLGISLRANIGNYVYNAPKNKYGIKANSLSIYQNNNLLDNTFLFDNASEQLNLSSYFVENASFLRCDNITLGYTFNPLLKDRLNLRIFAAVQNPFVITKYKGLDPEVFSGIDNDIYPRPITCTLGLVATF